MADGPRPRRPSPIEKLGWKRLAAIYVANHSDRQIRHAIQTEAQRCGYTPSTILALHYEA